MMHRNLNCKCIVAHVEYIELTFICNNSILWKVNREIMKFKRETNIYYILYIDKYFIAIAILNRDCFISIFFKSHVYSIQYHIISQKDIEDIFLMNFTWREYWVLRWCNHLVIGQNQEMKNTQRILHHKIYRLRWSYNILKQCESYRFTLYPQTSCKCMHVK